MRVQMLFKKGKEKAFQTTRVDTEKDRLKALEYLSLSIDIQWPLSIVLSRHSMLVYQFYFKHLTLCKVWPGPIFGFAWCKHTRAHCASSCWSSHCVVSCQFRSAAN